MSLKKVTEPLTPGYLTSEFWTNVFLQVITAVITLGSVFGHTVNESGLRALIPVAAMLAAGAAQVWYTHSRKSVKVAALQNPVASAEPDVTVVNNSGRPQDQPPFQVDPAPAPAYRSINYVDPTT